MSLMKSLQGMIVRAVIDAVNSNKKCQAANIRLQANDAKTGIEHLEPYGFTANPLAGAEGIVMFPGGDRSHGVLITVCDRRYRLTGLQSGEVAIYTDEGDKIVLRRGNCIECDTRQFIVNAVEKITFNTPLFEVPNGEIKDKTSTMSDMRVIYNGHKHKGDSGGMTGGPTGQMRLLNVNDKRSTN